MKPREMRDRSMKQQGWTHRRKDQRAHPYLKIWTSDAAHDDGYNQQGHGKGATFTTEEQQFHFILWDRLVTL